MKWQLLFLVTYLYCTTSALGSKSNTELLRHKRSSQNSNEKIYGMSSNYRAPSKLPTVPKKSVNPGGIINVDRSPLKPTVDDIRDSSVKQEKTMVLGDLSSQGHSLVANIMNQVLSFLEDKEKKGIKALAEDLEKQPSLVFCLSLGVRLGKSGKDLNELEMLSLFPELYLGVKYCL